VSVGHVARAIEESGTPTVVVMVKAFGHVAERMSLPRVVLTPHPMGRPFGAAGDIETQREVLDAALDLLDRATDGGTIIDVETSFRPGVGKPSGRPTAH
jgi:hypothetical protein